MPILFIGLRVDVDALRLLVISAHEWEVSHAGLVENLPFSSVYPILFVKAVSTYW